MIVVDGFIVVEFLDSSTRKIMKIGSDGSAMIRTQSRENVLVQHDSIVVRSENLTMVVCNTGT